jgi:RNA 2',3'-cyclic 3'-phosphodiesterase
VEQANWFVGLSVRGGEFLAGLSPPAEVRLFGPADLHITLAFLGRVGELRARAAFAQVAALVLPARETELGEVVALGARRRPSAFAALPSRGRREIEAAMTAVRDPVCDAAEVARETRPALAHVTFARPTRRATPTQVQAAATWATALDLGRPRVRIESVALFTWAADRARGLFAIREEHALAREG